MTDRELLELAAKACGYDTSHPWNAERLTLDPPVASLCIDGVSTAWNPLKNDGDALRLAVTCGVDIRLFGLFPFDGMRRISTLVDRLGRGFNEFPDDNTAYSLTRRAIVRAAAEIGKGVVTPNV